MLSAIYTKALKYLLFFADNAYDPDVKASQLWIDKIRIHGKLCLTFTDNGNGMQPDKLHKMLR
jgi:C4-dicarboxylate-specific signal transduction histidine kinase